MKSWAQIEKWLDLRDLEFMRKCGRVGDNEGEEEVEYEETTMMMMMMMTE